MVGDPKSLHDLRRIEADILVTCRACGRSRGFDRELLMLDLMRRGQNGDWASLRNRVRCTAARCRSRDVRLVPIPFGERTKLPRPVQSTIEAAAAYLAVSRGCSDQERVEALNELRLATRRLASWAKYDLGSTGRD